MPGKVNESTWGDAKAAARKQYGKKLPKDRFYAVVSTIYRNMGGKFHKATSVNGLQKLSDSDQQDRHWQPMTAGRAAKIILPSLAVGAGLTAGVNKGLQTLGTKFKRPWLQKGLRHSLLLGVLADIPPTAMAVYQASRPPKPKRLDSDLIRVRTNDQIYRKRK